MDARCKLQDTAMLYIADEFLLGLLDCTQHTNVSITPISFDDIDAILKGREYKTIHYMSGTDSTIVYNTWLGADPHPKRVQVVITPDDTVFASRCIKDPETFEIQRTDWVKITISNAESLAKALSSSEEPLTTESTLGESILS